MAGQNNSGLIGLTLPKDFYAGSPRRDALWRACPPECQAYMQWQAKAVADLRALSELVWDCRFLNGFVFKGRVLRAAQPFAENRLFADWEEKRLARGAATPAASLYSLDCALLERIVRAALNRSDEETTKLVKELTSRGQYPHRAALQGGRGPDCRGVCRLFEALSWGALESAALCLRDHSSERELETSNQWLARVAVSTSLRALSVQSHVAASPGDAEDSEGDDDSSCAANELAVLTAAVAKQQHDVAAAVVQLSCPGLQRLSVESNGNNSMTAAAVAALPSCGRLRHLTLQGSFSVQSDDGGGLTELLRATDGSLECLELRGVHVARQEELCNALVQCCSLRSLSIGMYDKSEFSWPQLLASPHLRSLELGGIATAEGSAACRAPPAASLETLMLAEVLIGTQDAADMAALLGRLDRLSALRFGLEEQFERQQALVRPFSALTGLQELTLSSLAGARVAALSGAHYVKDLAQIMMLWPSSAFAVDLHTAFPALRTLRVLRLWHLRLQPRWLSASFAVALRTMASLASLSIVCCDVADPDNTTGLARRAPPRRNAAGADAGGPSSPPPTDADFGPTRLGPLLAALESCVALEELELVHVPLLSGDARHLASVAPRLPRLSKLTVLECKLSADSMAPLAESVPAGCAFVH